jgi:biotin operon repressor
MRFPNQRLAQLFTLLQNETLPQDELAQRLSVSTVPCAPILPR